MQSVTDDTMDDRTALVERFVREVWNGEDPRAIETLASPDLVVHQLAADNDLEGRDAFDEFQTEFREAVPDFHLEIRRTAAEGEYVFVLLQATGTPERPMQALRPTGESYDVPGFQLYRIEDDTVAEVWVLINALGVMLQLGLLPDSPGKVVRMLLSQLRQRLTGG